MTNLKPDRPQIITEDIEATGFYRKMDTEAIVERMIAGEYVLVEEFYSNGLQVLAELKKNLQALYSGKDFDSRREFRTHFRELSHRLLLRVENNALTVRKAPDIGWLKRLYPDAGDFYISFPDVQGLNSSWQWYQKGVKIDPLSLTIHPWFGTYFPTRFDHLILFDKWLQRYNGPRKSAMDIGIGSGVLSFQMLENGFQRVSGVDSNKNAIIGLTEERERLGYEETLDLTQGDLFSEWDFQSELIVFNPPWLTARHKLEEGIDKAVYYEDDLFTRFFDQADKHLAPGGRVVILFSNLARIIDPDAVHPVRNMLDNSEVFRKELFMNRHVKAGSRKTKRKNNRKNEKVELWVLKRR